MNHVSILESLLFVVGDEGLTINEIKEILNIEDNEIKEIIEQLSNSYNENARGITLTILGNRLKLITKKENKNYIKKLSVLDKNDTLTDAALETLAIIAYNQPITRIMVDEIRGVSSSYLIRKLICKNLISEIGRSEAAGRPVLYATTSLFLDYFGLKSISDLPNIEISSDDSVKDIYKSKYQEESI